MATMKAAQVGRAGGSFELVERPIPNPGPGQVRIRVEACGICHSDLLIKEGHWPGLQFPRIPGHEIAGRIDALGEGVTLWQPGQRVGVGWHGGHCLECEPCRRGDFAMCRKRKVTGADFDGGYAQFVVVPAQAAAAIPEPLPASEAAPLLCAGITVFNALRHCGAMPGQVVAVQGVGGLGHLGIQYARQMGYRVVALNRGRAKEALAAQLGAAHYIDLSGSDPIGELQKLGGAQVILATAPNSKALSALVEGLAPRGKLLVIAAALEPLSISGLSLIGNGSSVSGWYSGVASDSEDTLRFSAQSGVRAMIESYPLARVNEAFERMIQGKARFRVVLTMD